ncbi:MAG: ribosome silencing factor [Clostridia bacterium]|nr:ribosome silencing factor [Clostridia bacterium]
MDKKLEIIVKALDDKKARDIQVLKVEDLTSIGDYFVIAGGTSNTHVRSLAEEVEFKLEEAGIEIRGIEGRATGWILLDCYDVLVHVFMPEVRDTYNLERLWGDAAPVDISDLISE